MIDFFKGILIVLASICVGGTLATLTAPTKLPPPPAVERIMYSPGGSLAEFIERYNKLRKDHTLVVLDGQCISACTFVTGMIEPSKLCATPFAKLVFHSAYYTNEMGEKVFSKDGTEVVWHAYPPKLRALLQSKGWNADEHNDLIFIEGDELLSVVRPCTPQEFTP